MSLRALSTHLHSLCGATKTSPLSTAWEFPKSDLTPLIRAETGAEFDNHAGCFIPSKMVYLNYRHAELNIF